MRAALWTVLAMAGCDDPTGPTDAPATQADSDRDGVIALVDCDDSDAAVNPNADESCNGIDDDCDGAIDNAAVDAQKGFVDADRDGA